MVGMNIRSRTLSSDFQDDANQLPYMMWNSWMGKSQQWSSRSVLLQVSLLTLELWITNYLLLYGITYLWKCHYRVGLLGVKYATLPQRTVWSWRRSWLETMWSFNNIVRKEAEYRFSKPKSLQVLTESLEDGIGVLSKDNSDCCSKMRSQVWLASIQVRSSCHIEIILRHFRKKEQWH